jgi:hypothetical protein
MRGLDLCLVGQLRDTLRDRQHMRYLLGGELELASCGREQALASAI